MSFCETEESEEALQHTYVQELNDGLKNGNGNLTEDNGHEDLKEAITRCVILK